MAYLGRKGQTAALASADLPTNSITTSHIVANAVTSAKIGVDVIVAEDIAANAITVAEIADDAVTGAKLANNIAISTTGAITTTGALAGATLTTTGNIVMGDDTSIGIADDAERIEFDGAGDISLLGCNVGIGTSAPTSPSGYDGAVLEVEGSGASHGPCIHMHNSTTSDNWEFALEGGSLKILDETAARMTIASSGNVGIGITPSHPLHVEGNYGNVANQPTIFAKNTGGAAELTLQGGGDIWRLNTNYTLNQLDFKSGTSTLMQINASGLISGDFNDTSDEALKENILSLESGALLKINSLRPVSFDWKTQEDEVHGKGSTVGFIAQEVEAIFPTEVVGEDYDASERNQGKAINTIGIVAHLTKAIQELSAKVTALESA